MLFYFVINLRGAPVSNRQRFIFETRLRASISGGFNTSKCTHRPVAESAAAPHYKLDITSFAGKLIRKESWRVALGWEARAARVLVRTDWPTAAEKVPYAKHIQGDVHSIYKLKLGVRHARAPPAPTHINIIIFEVIRSLMKRVAASVTLIINI